MKRNVFSLFPLTLLGLGVMSVFAWLLACAYPLWPRLQTAFWAVHLILPLLLMVGAIVVHKCAKGRPAGYLLAYLCNAIGSGCTVGAIWGVRSRIPAPELLAALVPAAVICALSLLILGLRNEKARGAVVTVLTVLALALTVGGGVLWPLHSMPLGCTVLFTGLFILPFPIAVSIAGSEPEQRFRYLSYSGFGALIFIVIAAALILSGGDLLDGLDAGFDFDFGKKKKGK